ncbi:VWA domain-containing protein, partial [bacterium]|nr:VWA domain-containing protein [candidate division CSSED10-310 bacterium]
MCKRRKRFIYFIGLLLIIVSLLPNNNDVNAYQSLPQEEVGDQTCSQVQIVLLIDQSLSMRDNDPNELRSYAPLHLVDVLARNYLMAEANQDPKVQPKRIDFAVIHFASMAEVLLDWTRIAPTDDAAWQTRRSELKEVFEAYPNYDLIGNGTNFVRAFEVAEDMFQNDETPVDGCPQRLVMVLTDGRPQIGENAWTNSQVEDHFLNISDITNTTFNIEGTDVYVTAIQNAGDTFYWRDTKDFWKAITQDDPDYEIPRAEMVTSRSEIGGRMADIIKTTIGEGVVVLEPGPIVIPPYVDRMILDFYKTDTEDLMILEDSAGELTEARTDVEVHVYGQDSAIQTLEIIRPEPGVYQLSTT